MSYHRSAGWFTGMTLCTSLGLTSPTAFAQTTYRAIELVFPGTLGAAASSIDAGKSAGAYVSSVYYIRKRPHYRYHAVYWPGIGVDPVELNPFSSIDSTATGISGDHQAGFFLSPVGGNQLQHAVVWAGSAGSAIDLNPFVGGASYAYGIAGNKVVGEATPHNSYTHAMLWDIVDHTLVDLNSPTLYHSSAAAVGGSQQVGSGNTMTGSVEAWLWSGTAASGISLNPGSSWVSAATGVNGGVQVGYGSTYKFNFQPHALLWHGTASSAVDLNPRGFIYSYAFATNGDKQVGTGSKTPTMGHALVWSGKTTSYVDLQSFLPANIIESTADGVDAGGDIVGFGFDSAGAEHVFLWQPVK